MKPLGGTQSYDAAMLIAGVIATRLATRFFSRPAITASPKKIATATRTQPTAAQRSQPTVSCSTTTAKII